MSGNPPMRNATTPIQRQTRQIDEARPQIGEHAPLLRPFARHDQRGGHPDAQRKLHDLRRLEGEDAFDADPSGIAVLGDAQRRQGQRLQQHRDADGRRPQLPVQTAGHVHGQQRQCQADDAIDALAQRLTPRGRPLRHHVHGGTGEHHNHAEAGEHQHRHTETVIAPQRVEQAPPSGVPVEVLRPVMLGHPHRPRLARTSRFSGTRGDGGPRLPRLGHGQPPTAGPVRRTCRRGRHRRRTGPSTRRPAPSAPRRRAGRTRPPPRRPEPSRLPCPPGR